MDYEEIYKVSYFEALQNLELKAVTEGFLKNQINPLNRGSF